MRLIVVFGVAAIALAGCASTPRESGAPALPFDAGNGIGSQFGNYEMKAAGETTDAAGDHCVIYNWDRRLKQGYAIRYSSMSCNSKIHPGWDSATTYTRSVIPISKSNLADGTVEKSN